MGGLAVFLRSEDCGRQARCGEPRQVRKSYPVYCSPFLVSSVSSPNPLYLLNGSKRKQTGFVHHRAGAVVCSFLGGRKKKRKIQKALFFSPPGLKKKKKKKKKS